MAIQKKTCVNHPDRRAIGVCVITGQSICAECSTRYEGVNYSKEGLQRLHEGRARQGRKTGLFRRLLRIGILLAMPVFGILLYYSYLLSFQALLEIMR